jgi:hypothetical protein
MSVPYSKYSPYYTTSQSNGYLDIWNSSNIPALADDILFTVTKSYEYRPDLLAYDLYGQVNLWWVFAVRNLDTIQDPIFDLQAGTKIYLPQLTTLKSSLGI